MAEDEDFGMGTRLYLGFVLDNPGPAGQDRAMVMAWPQNQLKEDKLIPSLRRLGPRLRGAPAC
eukprot:9409914-Lingulodinium_polyedra.AAC.1